MAQPLVDLARQLGYVGPYVGRQPLVQVARPAAARDEPLRALAPVLVVDGESDFKVWQPLDLRVREQVRKEGGVLDAEPYARAVVRRGCVRGVPDETDAGFVVFGERVLPQVEDTPLSDMAAVSTQLVPRVYIALDRYHRRSARLTLSRLSSASWIIFLTFCPNSRKSSRASALVVGRTSLFWLGQFSRSFVAKAVMLIVVPRSTGNVNT